MHCYKKKLDDTINYLRLKLSPVSLLSCLYCTEIRALDQNIQMDKHCSDIQGQDSHNLSEHHMVKTHYTETQNIQNLFVYF